ncbi:diaminopimelate decarboxylase [Candidatus Bathyarchaeota archaeon]|nr:diaminopimelate decarboxylase [Candidatus Bathyarchaeota archaeon]
MAKFIHEYFENKDGVLYIDGVSSLKLAKEFDTPLYVMSERRIRDNFRLLSKALTKHYSKVRIYYSAKANTSLSVLKILLSEGSCVDAVSPGEVYLALNADFPPEKILFTGTSVRNDELRFLVESNVTINVDSISQLKRLLRFHVPDLLSVRVNPEVGAGHHEHVVTGGKASKFGIWQGDVVEAYKTAKKAGVKKFGIQMHIGSGNLTVEPYLEAIEKQLQIAGHVKNELGVDFEFIDIGGGIGVPYRPEEKPLNIDEFAEKILELFKNKTKEYELGEPWIYLEPGRFIICDAVVLLTAVNTVKATPFKKFVGVDAGFNTLIRPAMYGSYHPIVVANKLNEPEKDIYDVAGPLCESGDIIARDRKLPKIEEGDLLAVLNAGAYGFSMSSQYNSRPRCAEVLVKDGEYVLVRERETFETLLERQTLPPWLK